MDKVRIASIGTSTICSIFCESIQNVDEIEYVGCFSRDINRAHEFGEARGARLFFDNLDDLAASNEIDAVYISSPNAYHTEQALAMIRGNKHVLIEKPMALNYSDAQLIFNEAKKHGVVALEAMRTIHDPNFVTLGNIVCGMDDIHEASFVFSKLSSKWAKLQQGVVTSAFSPKAGGGALRDMGIYTVEPAMYLFGYPDKFTAMGNMYEVEGEGILDLSGKAILSYDTNTVCLSWGKDHDSHLCSEVSSEKSCVVVDHIEEPSHIDYIVPVKQTGGYSTGEGVSSLVELVKGQKSLEAECCDFARYILGSKDTNITYEKAQSTTLDSIKLVEEMCKQMGVTTY